MTISKLRTAAAALTATVVLYGCTQNRTEPRSTEALMKTDSSTAASAPDSCYNSTSGSTDNSTSDNAATSHSTIIIDGRTFILPLE